MMRFLFLSTRQAKPSFRFRIEQMLPWFRRRGHECDVAFLPASAWSRLPVYRRLGSYDAVVLQKRLLSRAELFVVRSRSRRLVYDLDDAVMFDGRGEPDRRRQARFGAVVRAADLVICGNNYLADQARRYGDRVVIVPTAIDTATFHPGLQPSCRDRPLWRSESKADPPRNVGQAFPLALSDGGGFRRGASEDACPTRTGASGDACPTVAPRLVTVGWTGSRSTTRYLNELLPVLARLAGRIRLKFLSDSTDGLDPRILGKVPHTFVPWSPDVEITETASFDVGVMPLPDNAWTRGKCGFKALQYMALGIPAVCSRVGVNREIIEHGANGLLAGSRDDWHRHLARLIDDPAERERLGRAGRTRVEATYALGVQGPRMVEAVESVVAVADRRSA